MFGQVSPSLANPNSDYAVSSSPADGVSGLAFSPNSQFLLASSWASSLSCWECQIQETMGATQCQALPRAQVTLGAPALCCAMSADGATAFAGLGDGSLQAWPLGQPATHQVGKHDVQSSAGRSGSC